MDFAELQAEVIQNTSRPDRSSETSSAVKAATLKAHQFRGFFFNRDLDFYAIDLGTRAHLHQWDFKAEIPRYRGLKKSGFTRLENAGDTEGSIVHIIDSSEILDSYQRYRTDIAFVAGDVLNIRAAVDFQYANIGIYTLPDITDVGYSSWIADLHPYSIIWEAARIVCKVIGKDAEAQGFAQQAAEEYINLINNNATDAVI